jgi:hypothetical protein
MTYDGQGEFNLSVSQNLENGTEKERQQVTNSLPGKTET